jgi:hypothetical protein
MVPITKRERERERERERGREREREKDILRGCTNGLPLLKECEAFHTSEMMFSKELDSSS